MFKQKVKSYYVIGLIKRNFLVHYRMWKFYVRHGMIDEEIQEIISFGQNLTYKFFYTKKRDMAVKEIEKKFHK